MTSLDSLFDVAGRKDVAGLSRETLLHTEFTTSDPESLDGISELVPDLGVPEVEFRYNMSGRGEMVRCVYCKYPNHFDGFVVKYSDGTRNLVGRDCAVSHHGVDLERHLNKKTSERPRDGPRPIERLYDVILDVSNEPVDQWFDLRVDATYWNVFETKKDQWIGVPVQFPTESLILELISKAKPFLQFQREAYARNDQPQLANDPTSELSQDRTIITWRVPNAQKNWIYKITWDW